MPLIRKIVRISGSYCVFLPKDWVFYWKKNKPIKKVEMDIGNEIVIRPYLGDEHSRKS